MKQYSLTSIWYWGLNSVAFIVATFGTVRAIVPAFQPPLPVESLPEPVEKPFKFSFNPYKPNNSNFRLTLLPIPNAESQKCEVFSCLPPNPLQNYDDLQLDNLPSPSIHQDNARYISSDSKPYKLDTDISFLPRSDIFIPVTPIPQPTIPPQTTSGIFFHTYELYSASEKPLPQTQTVENVSMTLGDAVYLALGALNVNVIKTPTDEPSYKWDKTGDIGKTDLKLSLMKDTDSKIARLNQLIDKQDSRNTLNRKITDVIIAYRNLQQAQGKVKISEDGLDAIKKSEVDITKHRINLLVAKNQVEARRLELGTMLGLDKKKQIVATDIPVVKPTPLDFQKLRLRALNNQPNHYQLKQQNEAVKESELDKQLHNSIQDINSIYTQLEGARATTLLAQQLVDVEYKSQNIENLTIARNTELNLTIKYLNALTNLDLLLGTTLDTWQISVQSK